MDSATFRFDRFCLDAADRQLTRDDVPVELNSRYFDALALLVGEDGRLVSKDRFLDEVWHGVPVTDEALTQCIKTLRSRLGDNAARPRFIETVPKHGYRFIAPVERNHRERSPAARSSNRWREFLLLGAAGTVGGGMAGVIGGLIYGFAGASQPLHAGMGAASVLLVVMCLSIVVALMGGAGVAFGIAAATVATGASYRTIIGGAAGGLLVGGIVKLLGIDAFNLLLGQSPGDITGAAEGLVLGAAVGFGALVAGRLPGLRRGVAAAGAAGAIGGLLITVFGGRLMAGSLDLLARSMPGSRLRLDPIGALFGESGFGPVAQVVTGGLEGALFAACIVGAMILSRR